MEMVPRVASGSAEERARLTAERMRAVAEAASGMIGARSLLELDRVLRESCKRVLPHDVFTFAVYDPMDHVLRFVEAWDGDAWEGYDVIPLRGMPSELVVVERRSLLTLRADDPAGQGAVPFGSDRRSESAIRTPLLAGDRVLAVVSVQSYTPDFYSAEDVEVLETFAAVAAGAMRNIELLEERDRLERERRRRDRRSERALRRARAEAEAASEAKSRFLSILSHELRTPLSAVIGVADLLGDEIWGPLNDVQKEHLRRVTTSAWHLVGIIDEILTFTRSEAGMEEATLTEVDLAGIARSVADLLDGEARARGLALDVVGVETPVVVTTDAGKARQILTNLVGNAIKYTDTGGVRIELARGDEWLELHIHDTGPGIPAEHLDRIFEPFSQLDQSKTRTTGGAGLGLAICRRLAALLGGEVTVASTVGEGSTFTWRLRASS